MTEKKINQTFDGKADTVKNENTTKPAAPQQSAPVITKPIPRSLWKYVC